MQNGNTVTLKVTKFHACRCVTHAVTETELNPSEKRNEIRTRTINSTKTVPKTKTLHIQ